MKAKIMTMTMTMTMTGLMACWVHGAEEVAEAAGTQVDAVQAVLDTGAAVCAALPMPWSAIGAAVLACAGAVWAWRKTQKKTKDDGEEMKEVSEESTGTENKE